jgi:hypothetical protein
VLLGLLFLGVALLPQRRWWHRPGWMVTAAGALAVVGGVAVMAQAMV